MDGIAFAVPSDDDRAAARLFPQHKRLLSAPVNTTTRVAKAIGKGLHKLTIDQAAKVRVFPTHHARKKKSRNLSLPRNATQHAQPVSQKFSVLSMHARDSNYTLPLVRREDFPTKIPPMPLPPSGLAVGPLSSKRSGLVQPLGEVRWKGGEYQKPMYARYGTTCQLSGVLGAEDLRVRLASVPRNCCPRSRRSFITIATNASITRVDVLPNCELSYGGGSSDGGWVSLDGIGYSVPSKHASGSTLVLEDAWENFGAPYSKALFRVNGAYCALSGLIRVVNSNMTAWSSLILTLPLDCRPLDGDLSFMVGMHTSPQQVDVKKDGRVFWQGGNREKMFLSLDGISFFVESSAHIRLVAPVEQFGQSWRRPSFRRDGSFCVASGRVRIAPGTQDIGILPSRCRPTGRSIFTLSSGEHPVRVDVEHNGRIILVDGPIKDTWISLDGIRLQVDEGSARKKLKVPRLTGTPLRLGPYYSPKGDGFVVPQVYHFGQICIFYGTAAGPKKITGPVLARVPRSCRPTARLTFDMHISNLDTMRTDLLPDGRLLYAGGSRKSQWFDLNSMVLAPHGGTLLTLNYPWTNMGGSVATATAMRDGDFVALGGVLRLKDFLAITEGKKAFNNVITKLPSQFCPKDGVISFSVNYGEFSKRLDVLPNCELQFPTKGQKIPEWLSLSGVRYFVKQEKPLKLQSGYFVYGEGHRVPTYRREGLLCVFSGRIGRSGGGPYLFHPKDCKAPGHLVFGVNHNEFSMRIDVRFFLFSLLFTHSSVHVKVLPNGKVMWVEGSDRYKYINLDGIQFVVGVSKMLSCPPFSLLLDRFLITCGRPHRSFHWLVLRWSWPNHMVEGSLPQRLLAMGVSVS